MTAQSPINSGFNAASTSEDIIQGINLKAKNVIVTGGYSGLGRHTVKTLSEAGAYVIVPARDVERAKTNLEGLHAEVWPMDLMDPSSIAAFAAQFLQQDKPLHLLINCAGIMACPLEYDSRGYESQFAVNHLGHFQLTMALLPALKAAHGARLISVSSLGHRYSPVNFDDPNFRNRPYDRWAAYGQSKTANILFAVAFDRRYSSDGIRAFALHPGSIVGTGLDKHISRQELIDGGVLDKGGNPIYDPSQQLKTVTQGAATIVWCATSMSLNGKGGVYCENCEIARLRTDEDIQAMSLGDGTKKIGVMPYAIDPVSADKLWEMSFRMLGMRNASAS